MKKIKVLITSFLIVGGFLMVALLPSKVEATAATIVSAKITSPTQFTVVYSVAVNAVYTNYSNLSIDGQVATSVDSMTGTGTATHVITFTPSMALTTASTGTVDIASLSGTNTFTGQTGQALTDAQAPTGVVSLAAPLIRVGSTTQAVTVTYNEPMAATHPTIAFNHGTFVSNSDGAWADTTHYHESFHDSSAEQFSAVTVTTSGATDTALNAENSSTSGTNNPFVLNTVAPTVTSISAYTDRIIINFNKNVDGMQATNCSNYTLNSATLSCSGPGTPFIDFQGNQETIKGLTLTSGSTPTFGITGGVINDTSGNSLATYTHTFGAVSAPSLPVISSLSVAHGAVGDAVTITGSGFGAGSPGDSNHKVFFSSGFDPSTGPKPPVEADYTGATWSATSISVKVPVGAQGGPINVMVGGVMSDMNSNSFFDIAASYTAHVYFSGDNSAPMSDGSAGNIRIIVSGMNGPVVHKVGDGAMTYSNGSPGTFTITGVSSMGGVWAYDVTGAHLNSTQQPVNTSATQTLHLPASYHKISGTITLGSPCTSAGQSKNIVVMATPQTVDTGSVGFQPMAPAFFTTDASFCTVTYNVGVPAAGIYRVEAHIPPDPTATAIASAAFTEPDALSITMVSSDVSSGTDLPFTSAAYEIHGTVIKPGGSTFSSGDTSQSGMLFIYAYQPRTGGKGTGTQVNPDGTFTLYVDQGVWKLGVSGPNMPNSVETEVDVDSTYTIAAAKGPTIVIAPQTDYIEGYVKDSAGNGLANVSVYAWNEGAPGGGGANTDSQGYYKMYVSPGTAYHVGANSQSYGFLGEQHPITVSSSTHPTVNFNVSSNNWAISGTVLKGGHALQQAFVFITEGEHGSMLGNGGTDSSGAYTVRVPTATDGWLHVGIPGQGEIYEKELHGISANDATQSISITSKTIKVQISPASLFDEAFVGIHSNNGGGFANTSVVADGCTGATTGCKEYTIDVAQPSGSSVTYYIDASIPGYGPLPETSLTLDSSGNFTESNTTGPGTNIANDGVIGYALTGLHTISGTVTGTNVTGAWVWASGPNGGTGAAVADNGSYSLQLRDGTYDVGVGKPNFIGNKISVTVSGADVSSGTGLTLSSAGSTITGTVYLPDGTTLAVGANVWADNGNGGFAGATTDANGAYTLSVGSGSWTVKAAYDGYNSTGLVITAPATGANITLVTVSGFTPNTTNSPVTPSAGGIVKDTTGGQVDIPSGAMGTSTSAGTVTITSTTNVVTKKGMNLIGTAKEFTATAAGSNVTSIPGATITLTASKTDLANAGIDTIAKAQAMKISYYDSTAGTWTEIPTVVTLSVPGAATIAALNTDPAITLSGTTSHFSTYALTTANSASAPGVPTGLTATANDSSASLSWTAPTGTPAAAKYDIYKKVGDLYTYLAQTASTSYTASSLTNGVAYYFKVSALDNSTPTPNESAATSAVSVTPVAPSTGGGGLVSSSGGSSSNSSSSSASSSSNSSSTTTPSTTSTTTALTTTPTVTLTTSTVIDGCGSRTTGFSATTGQSCVGNVSSASASASANANSSSSTTTYNFGTVTLKNGSKGEGVKELQRFLNRFLNLGLVVDGKLGPKTIAVIKKWQKAHRLKADGLIGPKTKALMNSEAKKN